MSSSFGIFSPGERPMIGHEDARSGRRICPLKAANNGVACVVLVVFGNLLISHLRGYGYWTMEIIRMRGAETWNGLASLGPGGGIFRVRVGDAANFGELVVQH